MRSSILSGRWFVAQAAAVLSIVALFIFSTSAYPQTVPLPNAPGAPVGDVSNIPKSITDTMAGVGDRNGPHGAGVQGNKVSESEATCLFPPLSLIKSPIVTVDELRPTAKARKEYWQSEEHTSELQSPVHLVCRLLLEKKKKQKTYKTTRKSETVC